MKIFPCHLYYKLENNDKRVLVLNCKSPDVNNKYNQLIKAC